MDVLQRSEKSQTGCMEEKKFSDAHWSATPVEVDADVLMRSLLEAIKEAEEEKRAWSPLSSRPQQDERPS